MVLLYELAVTLPSLAKAINFKIEIGFLLAAT